MSREIGIVLYILYLNQKSITSCISIYPLVFMGISAGIDPMFWDLEDQLCSLQYREWITWKLQCSVIPTLEDPFIVVPRQNSTTPGLILLVISWVLGRRIVISKAENYMPRFPIPSGAPCSLTGLFSSVQHCLEMLVHYLVTLSYKPVQQSQTHNRWLHCISAGQCFYNDMHFALRLKARTAAHHSAYNSQPIGMIIHRGTPNQLFS